MGEDIYRFLLRMPYRLRERLQREASGSGRSLNAEIVHRLETSLEHRESADLRDERGTARKGRNMSRRQKRRLVAASVVLVLALAAVGAAIMRGDGGTTAAPTLGEEVAPALAAKLAQSAKFAPPGGMSNFQEGGRTAEDDEWMKHAIPGTDIPSAAIAQSSADWDKLQASADWGGGSAKWTPLGPSWGKGLPNPYRDRAVYNAGTPDFSGRIAHTVIDPKAAVDEGKTRNCRLWIANANGGVWRTNNALAQNPQWQYLSEEFEHNSINSLELDPNDGNSNTIWAGTGESNACGSGCEAGVGIYKSTNSGTKWSGPFGQSSGRRAVPEADCHLQCLLQPRRLRRSRSSPATPT